MYIVMEIQVFADGKVSSPCLAYTDRKKAESKYYNILSSAALSSLPVHSAVLLTDTGKELLHGSYENPQEVTNEG